MGPANRTRFLIRLGLLLGVALFAYAGYGMWLAGRDEQMLPPSNAPVLFQHGTALGQRLTGRSWTADYDRIVTSTDQTSLDLYGVKHAVIFKDGKPYLRVTAERMTVNTVTHDFSATGKLHVETVGRTPTRTFDTESANWSDVQQTLTLPDKARIGTGASLPLLVGSATFDVKTGDLELRQVAGAVRFK